MAAGAWVVGMLLLAPAATTQKSRPPAPPNVVLIVADGLGYADIGPYGATDVRTPALLRLAAQGARWTDSYAAAATCAPSRAALLTGRFPRAVGISTNVAAIRVGLSNEHPTLASWLHDIGYRTGVFGKWHLGSRPTTRPRDHGFETFFGFDGWSLDYFTHLDEKGEPRLVLDGEPVERDGYLTDLISEAAIDFVREQAAQPFFVYLSYNAPLPPYEPPDTPREQWDHRWMISSATRADYVGMVEALDAGIGRLLAVLDQLQLTEDTLVIFTDDHGGLAFSDEGPLFEGFASLWEGGIRVPLIVRWPGHVLPGSVVARPTIAMDVTASVLAAAGVSAQVDGTPLWNDQGLVRVDAEPRALFWEMDRPRNQLAMRRGPWKMMVDEGTNLLFDLTADPSERVDLLAKNLDLGLQMRKEAMQWYLSLPGTHLRSKDPVHDGDEPEEPGKRD